MSTVFDSRADTIKVKMTPTNVIIASITAAIREDVLAGDIPATNIVAINMRVGHLPLQGTKLFVSMAINRSRGELMLLQEIMPAALQPNPIHIVMACFPCAPANWNNLSRLNATLGKNPTSSKMVKISP